MDNLHQTIISTYNLDELRVMAANLGVGWESLSGDTIEIKALELIEHMTRRNRLDDLKAQMGVTVPELPQRRRLGAQKVQVRHAMLRQVRNHWIEGVLENSLHGAVWLELGLDEAKDAVERPWQMRLEYANQESRELPSSERIVEVFDQLGGRMLILGEPGSGKTTTLLQLAKELLIDAEKNVSAPIPVVLNLSSWGFKREPLEKWLVEELNNAYGVGRKFGREWLEDEPFHLLLDGLDEVKVEYRDDCVTAINTFRQEHSLMEVVVCCRIKDYEALGEKLNLNGAVVIQPLEKEHIDKYLAGAGGQLEGVRQAMAEDEELAELAEVPLTLSIITKVIGKSLN